MSALRRKADGNVDYFRHAHELGEGAAVPNVLMTDKLRSVVGAQIHRLSVFEEQGIESIQNLGMAHLGSDGDAKRGAT